MKREVKVRFNIECVWCGEEFSSKSRLSKYCSPSCRAKTIYRRHKERELRRSRERYFDMKENDYEKLTRQNQKAKRKYREKVRFNNNRIKVFERDNHSCRVCGSKDRIGVHHKNEKSYKPRGEKETIESNKEADNRMSNLITLCISCHGLLHWWQRKNDKILLDDKKIIKAVKQRRKEKGLE